MVKEVQLIVAEARQRDIGRGKIRIDDNNMAFIGITTGDVVEIVGNKKITGAIAWPAYIEDTGAGIIRMDGIIRRNAGVSLEEKVFVRRARVKVAKSVSIAPTQHISLDYGFETFVKRKLLGYPVTKSDVVLISILGRAIRFVVKNTSPSEIVLITDTTRLEVSDKPITEDSDDELSRVSYEDVGGLSQEIQKIREMVELPLKHPELFKKLGIDPPKGVLLHGPPGTGKTLIAKAVATESEANFISIQGPEIMSKFYGECIAEDSLVITNSGGLKTIGEAIQEKEVHSVAGLNFETGKVEILPVKEIFDKGVQNTLKIITPHGRTEVTPTSRLLVLRKGKPTWIFADDLKVGDQVASPRSLSMGKTEIPLILPYLPDKTLIGGSLVKSLFSKTSGYGKNKEFAQKLDVTQRKFEEFKYGGRKIPAVYIKRLFSFFPEKNQFFLELSKNRKVPLYMTEDLMYIIGLLSGDGHLRYSPSAGTVTQVILTSSDLNIQDRYSKAVKATFNVELTLDPDSSDTLYFNSRPIGDLLHNLGIPFSRKAYRIKVPPYIINLPKKYLCAYLQGLYDAGGNVQYTGDGKEPKNIQINYSTVSKELAMGIRLCLLRFGIVSTLSYRKKDASWRVHISDVESIDKFRLEISFNHKKRHKRLNEDFRTKYTRPSYDRIPIARWIYEIGKPLGITQRELLHYNINPRVKGLTRDQLQKAYWLLSKKGLDQTKLDLIQKLIDQEVIWTPIREIKKSRNHVYDFEVPSHHNFVANGLLVHNSEARLRDIFKEAEKTSPSIVFIDEIDAIAPKREEVTGEVERRVVAQILSLMDGLESRGQTIVIGATNRVNALDPALRRPGRFDREIEISVPDKIARLEILQIHTRRMPGIEEIDLENLAEITHGFVGADLAALAREAAMRTLREILPKINLEEETIPAEVLEDLKVGMEHFKSALKEIQPTAVREVFLEVPNVHWTDVGGLEEAKQELIEVVEWPLKRRENIQRMGINPPNGVLLYGPPGSGKTLLAKAVATESEANFIAIKGPELISKWVGESEKAIREIFRKARTASPAIIFFDEIDATAVRRGVGDSTLVNERVISQLLTEMDGMEPLTDVIIIAATNRPDMIDPALLRPGRIDRLVNIPPPDSPSREKIFEIHTKGMPLSEDVNLEKLAKQTDSYVGADIELICREAAMLALREDIDAKNVYQRHFEQAMKSIHPSVTPELLKMYQDLEKNLKRRYTADKQPHFFG